MCVYSEVLYTCIGIDYSYIIMHGVCNAAIDKVTEILRTLVRQSGSQLNKLHDIDTSLESLSYGFSSLTKDVSILSKISDYQFASASEEAQCIEEHKVSTAEKLDEVQEKVSDVKDTINRIDGEVHPCGGMEWRQVVNYDFSDPTVACPPAWKETITYPRRGCGRLTTGDRSMDTVSFLVPGGPYTKVCGKILGYAFDSPTAFLQGTFTGGIDDVYVDGVSVTHGKTGNRTHIWTFAAAAAEDPQVANPLALCPCSAPDNPSVPQPPGFVGNDYFCEAGVDSNPEIQFQDELLWDGEDCFDPVCCTFNTPPYFNKILQTATSDPIDVRIMLANDQLVTDNDVSIEKIKLYIQ